MWVQYSMTAIKPFEEEVDDRIREWVAALDKRYCETGEALRFQQCMSYLAYDVGTDSYHIFNWYHTNLMKVTEIAFGEPLGFVKEWCDVRNLIQSFEDIIPIWQTLGRLPLLAKFTNAFRIWRPKAMDKRGFGLLIGV